jgi:predicted HAD superfamily Cof-like phosphohydrolase
VEHVEFPYQVSLPQFAASTSNREDAIAMTSDFDKVGLFHHKFDLDNVTFKGPGPRPVEVDLAKFRLKFLMEELRETADALGFRLECELKPNFKPWDHEKAADGLIDLSYVTLGTAHIFGYPWEDLFEEVQVANMAKERATRVEQSLRGSTFDVVKPKGWQPPNIKGVLKRFGWSF